MEFTKRNFNGGELSPAILARPDLQKYATGLKECENFFVLKEGGAYNRAGFKFLNHAISNDNPSRLIPFEFSTEQNYILEFGQGKMRVIKDGGFVLESNFTVDAVSGDTVTAAGHDFENGDTVFIQNVEGIEGINNRYLVIENVSGDDFDLVDLNNTDAPTDLTGAVVARLFELAHPYSVDDLTTIQYTQSADVMTLAHPDHPIYELSRFDHDNWTIEKVVYSKDIPSPTSVQAQPVGTDSTAASKDYEYVVTAVKDGTESKASATTVITMSAQSITYGAEVYWTKPKGGADYYNIYKSQSVGSGIYGWIGESKSTKFEDFNLAPIMTEGVPAHKNPSGKEYFTVSDASNFKIGQEIEGETSGATATIHAIEGNELTLVERFGDFEIGEVVLRTGAGFTCDNISGNFQEGESVTGTSGTGVVDYYYNESEPGVPDIVALGITVSTGTFSAGDSITGDTYGGTATVDTVTGEDQTETIDSFNGGNYPSTIAYYQQRFVTANSTREPQTVWTSKTGDYKDFRTSFPTVDSDAVTFTIAAEKVNEIRHILPLKSLMLLTSGGVWKVTEGQNDVLTPSSVGVTFQSAEGASWLRPIRREGSALYVQNDVSRIRDLNYSFENDSFSGRDTTIFARHLFEGHTIKSWCYTKEPFEIVWAVRDDGTLLGMAYDPEEQVLGWHRHTTQGEFEEVACITEGREEALYAVVKRTINGEVKRFVERMETRLVDTCEESYFLDAGLSYSGTPIQEAANLHHLEGMTVSAVGDGNYLGDDFVVQDGKIELDQEASFSTVHIGLSYEAKLVIPPIRFPDGVYEGKRKSVSEVTINYFKTRGAKVGVQANQPDKVKWREVADGYETPQLFSGEREIKTSMGWKETTDITVIQDKPFPCSILSLSPTFARGG